MKLTNSLEHAGVPYIFSGQGNSPGPVVTVLGGIHGNELAGIKLVKQLISKTHHQPIQNGMLHAAIGNIAAMKLNQRGTQPDPKQPQLDLNRCFGKPNGKYEYEQQRAAELKPFLAQTEILFDVHSTIKKSDPYVVIPNKAAFLKHKDLIAKLGIATVLTGEGLWPESKEPIYADTFVEANGGFGMTIEAGWIEDPKTMEIVHGVNAALHYLGIFEEVYPKSPEEVQFDLWHAYQNVIAPPGFAFKKNGEDHEWGNKDELAAGTVYAVANGQEFQVTEDSVIFFPKPKGKIVTGSEVCILAKKLAA